MYRLKEEGSEKIGALFFAQTSQFVQKANVLETLWFALVSIPSICCKPVYFVKLLCLAFCLVLSFFVSVCVYVCEKLELF